MFSLAFSRRRQARIPLFFPAVLLFLLLFVVVGSMQACGDFELWSEKSDTSDDTNGGNGRTTATSCEDPFPGLADFEADEINTLSSSLNEPITVAVVPESMAFSFDHDSSSSTDDISVEQGDLFVVDKGTSAGSDGRIIVYTYSSADNSTEVEYLSGLNEPTGIALVNLDYLSLLSYDFLFYAFEDGIYDKVNLQSLDTSDAAIEVVSDTTAEFTALAAGYSGYTLSLFLLDASTNKVLRVQKVLDWTTIISNLGDVTGLITSWNTPTDLFSGASTTLKDMVFSPATGSLYVLSSSEVYEITNAATRSDAITSPSALIALSSTTPAGLEIIYTDQSADSDAFLIMFNSILDSAQIQQYDADGDAVTDEKFSPLAANNNLKAIAYDCKNGRLVMTNSPRSYGTLAGGTLYEAPNP